MIPYPKIALVGEMGSGKSFAALSLKDRYNYRITSFAEPLKNLLVHYLTQSDPEAGQHTDWEKYVRDRKHNPVIRRSLQFLGDDLARTIHGDDVWIRHFEQKNGTILRGIFSQRCVVDDVRYQNEVDYLKQNGFHIIRITRDALEREAYLAIEIKRENPDLTDAEIDQLIKEWACHPSEAGIAGLDIDEEVVYTDFRTWVEDNIGSI